MQSVSANHPFDHERRNNGATVFSRRYWIVIIPLVALFPIAGFSGEFQYNPLNPDCTLQKFSARKWVVADPKDLDGKTFPELTPLSNDKKKAGVRAGTVWYGANFFCFNEVLTSDLKVKLADESSKKDQKVEFFERKKGEEGPERPSLQPHFYLELTGGLPKIRGGLANSTSVTDSGTGVTASSSAPSVGLDYGFRLGLSLGEPGTITFRLTQVQYTINSSLSGATAGSGKSENLQRQVSLGYLYTFNLGMVRPYFGGSLGYSFLKDDTTFSGFSNPSRNGTRSADGAGLYYAPEAGVEIVFDKWALVPNIRYDITKIKKETVNVSTIAALPEGTTSDVDNPYKALVISLGVRFIF